LDPEDRTTALQIISNALESGQGTFAPNYFSSLPSPGKILGKFEGPEKAEEKRSDM